MLDGGIELPRRDLARMAAVAARGDVAASPRCSSRTRTKDSRRPSGENAGSVSQPQPDPSAYGLRVMRRSCVPSARMIQTPLSVGLMSRSNAIQRPSGENTGWPWKPLGVSSRNPLPSRRTTAMLARSANSAPKASSRPSGDHAGCAASPSMRVTWRSPLPSGRMVNSCRWSPASCAYAIAPLRPGWVAAAGAAAVASAARTAAATAVRVACHVSSGVGDMVPPMRCDPSSAAPLPARYRPATRPHQALQTSQRPATTFNGGLERRCPPCRPGRPRGQAGPAGCAAGPVVTAAARAPSAPRARGRGLGRARSRAQ